MKLRSGSPPGALPQMRRGETARNQVSTAFASVSVLTDSAELAWHTPVAPGDAQDMSGELHQLRYGGVITKRGEVLKNRCDREQAPGVVRQRQLADLRLAGVRIDDAAPELLQER